MFGIILLLLVGNACLFKLNMQLSDKDLKYHFIKMYGGVSGNELWYSIMTGIKLSSGISVMRWRILNTVHG